MKLPVKISLKDATGHTFEFDKLETFLDFVRGEQEFWAKKAEELLQTKGFTNVYTSAAEYFKPALDTLKPWKKDAKTWDTITFTSHIQNLNNGQLALIYTKWIWSGQPFISAWLNSYSLSQATGEGFIQVTLTKSVPNINSYDWLRGYLLAYEFELQDESFITKRREAESQSFEHLRNVLTEQKDKLVGEISDFESKADNVTNTYVDFMRLKGPAKYWGDRAKACKDEGDKWAGWLIATTFVAIFTFGSLMYAWLNRFNTGVNFNNLEGVVIIAIALSLFVFALRSLAKLTFSSYHLQRDAEEREQLTHLYLALANDSKVDAESRIIVLQALFSRSESGLLSGESGPTLPVQDIVGLIKNQKPS